MTKSSSNIINKFLYKNFALSRYKSTITIMTDYAKVFPVFIGFFGFSGVNFKYNILYFDNLIFTNTIFALNIM